MDENPSSPTSICAEKLPPEQQLERFYVAASASGLRGPRLDPVRTRAAQKFAPFTLIPEIKPIQQQVAPERPTNRQTPTEHIPYRHYPAETQVQVITTPRLRGKQSAPTEQQSVVPHMTSPLAKKDTLDDLDPSKYFSPALIDSLKRQKLRELAMGDEERLRRFVEPLVALMNDVERSQTSMDSQKSLLLHEIRQKIQSVLQATPAQRTTTLDAPPLNTTGTTCRRNVQIERGPSAFHRIETQSPWEEQQQQYPSNADSWGPEINSYPSNTNACHFALQQQQYHQNISIARDSKKVSFSPEAAKTTTDGFLCGVELPRWVSKTVDKIKANYSSLSY